MLQCSEVISEKFVVACDRDHRGYATFSMLFALHLNGAEVFFFRS